MRFTKKCINLSTGKKINAEDQIIIAESKDDTQGEVFTLQNTANNFGMEISTEKFETMAVFFVQDPVRCEIGVGDKCLQQVRDFKYLGCEIS
jgi:hypothetical protein